MKQRLDSNSEQQAGAQSAQHHMEPGLEFGSVEDAIRFDAAHTEVPPQLHERLLRGIEAAKARRPWWRRWFR